MKKLILSAFLLVMLIPNAHAKRFSGNYQLLDKNGKVLHEAPLSVNRKVIDQNTGLAIYREVAGNNIVKTLCSIEVETSKTGATQVIENCGDEGLSIKDCVRGECKGSVQIPGILDGKKQKIVEQNTNSQRVQIITLEKPINYKGLKDLKTYIHVLKAAEK